MAYFNYHAKAKHLIKNGHCISASFFSNYRNIKPAMVLYFDNNLPMPIREYMWHDYISLLREHKIIFNNPDHINLDEFSGVN